MLRGYSKLDLIFRDHSWWCLEILFDNKILFDNSEAQEQQLPCLRTDQTHLDALALDPAVLRPVVLFRNPLT